MHFLKYMYALKWLLRFVSGCFSQLVIPNGVPSLVHTYNTSNNVLCISRFEKEKCHHATYATFKN